jgi:hypothetical protein
VVPGVADAVAVRCRERHARAATVHGLVRTARHVAVP